MKSSKLIKELRKLDVLRRGKVLLTSGEISDFYVDLKVANGYPQVLKLMSEALSKHLNKNTTCVASIGYGGISLSTAIALKNNLKLSLIRNEPRRHGSKKLIEGHVPNKKDKVVIVDDVLTTGRSIKRAIRIIKKTGAKVEKCLVVINRSPDRKFPFNIEYLLKAEDLF